MAIYCTLDCSKTILKHREEDATVSGVKRNFYSFNTMLQCLWNPSYFQFGQKFKANVKWFLSLYESWQYDSFDAEGEWGLPAGHSPKTCESKVVIKDYV